MIHGTPNMDLASLRLVPTPEPTRTWRPVPHVNAVQILMRSLESIGAKVTGVDMYTSPGNVYGETLEHCNLFCIVSVEVATPLSNLAVKGQIGLINSHGKIYALRILAGVKIFACTNGQITSELDYRRKHTSMIDPLAHIENSVEDAVLALKAVDEKIYQLQSIAIPVESAHSFVVNMARRGALPPSKILSVCDEFENPSFPEFAEHNVMNLCNAFTHTIKSRSWRGQFDSLRALHQEVSTRFLGGETVDVEAHELPILTA